MRGPLVPPGEYARQQAREAWEQRKQANAGDAQLAGVLLEEESSTLRQRVRALEAETDKLARRHAYAEEAAGLLGRLEAAEAGIRQQTVLIEFHAGAFDRERARAEAAERQVAALRAALTRIDNGQCIEGGTYGFCLTMHPDGLCSSCEAHSALSSDAGRNLTPEENDSYLSTLYSHCEPVHAGCLPPEVREQVVAAMQQARSALDGLLGDSELSGDDRPGVLACRALSAALALLEGHTSHCPAGRCDDASGHLPCEHARREDP